MHSLVEVSLGDLLYDVCSRRAPRPLHRAGFRLHDHAALTLFPRCDRMVTRGHGLVRLVFELDPRTWHGNASERLWAEPVGEDRFRLRNVPFYAFGVSVEDVVTGQERADGVYFTGVSIRGGHSTYRLILPRGLGDPAFQQYWAPLAGLGCSFEEGPVIAVDVPPSADIHATYRLLESGAAAGAWDFEEGHCGHPLL